MSIYNTVGESAATPPGLSNVTLDVAIPGYLAFDDAQAIGTGAISNHPVIVRIEDALNSASYEITRALYTKSGITKTLVRGTTPRTSSAAGAKVNFTGAVKVYVIADAYALGPEGAARSYALTAGSSTAYTATMKPAIRELVDGMEIEVEWHITCGGAPTLNLDGKGAKNIRGLRTGSMANVPSGTLLSGTTTRLRYRAASDTFDIVGSHSVSGSYTPTLTGVSNLTALTQHALSYSYVDGIVTMGGRFEADPAAAAGTFTELGMSLPIPSNFTDFDQCGGSGSAEAVTESVAFLSDATNDRARITFAAQTTANHSICFSCVYRVL